MPTTYSNVSTVLTRSGLPRLLPSAPLLLLSALSSLLRRPLSCRTRRSSFSASATESVSSRV